MTQALHPTFQALMHASQVPGAPLALDTVLYWRGLVWFLRNPASPPSACPHFPGPASRPHALHVYSLAKTLTLWSVRHYRAPSFQADILANLKNVAIPGTGVPLSWVCKTKPTALLFLFALYPLACLVAAVYLWRTKQRSVQTDRTQSISEWYSEQLLNPGHWFAIWRLNCVVVAFHEMVAAGRVGGAGSAAAASSSSRGSRGVLRAGGAYAPVSSEDNDVECGANGAGGSSGAGACASPASVPAEYQLEDKGAFLLAADAKGIPVSPFMRIPGGVLVAKHRGIEGGMGIQFLRSFTDGGDWILQERMANSPFIASLLPDNAPLSSIRVITASTAWLSERGLLRGGMQGLCSEGGEEGAGAADKPSPASPPASSPTHAASSAASDLSDYGVFTVVFRAGLAGASTDHSSICFDVDAATGRIGYGTSNLHWYGLGPRAVGRIPGSLGKRWVEHPDTGRPITGATIPDWEAVRRCVMEGHKALVPHVPLVGWDVALTPQGVSLLEINISCNFFNGSYDRRQYLAFVEAYFEALEAAAL